MPGCCARIRSTRPALGVRDYDDRIQDISAAARDRRAREAQAFLDRLGGIDRAALGPADRVNHAILRRTLAETVEANGFAQRDMLFTTYYGWHQGFAGMAANLPFRTRADFESYLARHRPLSADERRGAGDHRRSGPRRPHLALLGARRLRAHDRGRDRRPTRRGRASTSLSPGPGPRR